MRDHLRSFHMLSLYSKGKKITPLGISEDIRSVFFPLKAAVSQRLQADQPFLPGNLCFKPVYSVI